MRIAIGLRLSAVRTDREALACMNFLPSVRTFRTNASAADLGDAPASRKVAGMLFRSVGHLVFRAELIRPWWHFRG